jgi:uncharacterized membrane protein YraQ (UPF0718 family)
MRRSESAVQEIMPVGSRVSLAGSESKLDAERSGARATDGCGVVTYIEPVGGDAGAHEVRRPNGVEILVVAFVLVVLLETSLGKVLAARWLQTWMTIFLSVLTQAMPFLIFGVVLSSVIAVFVPAGFFARALPGHPALAVPVAGAAGALLPGCECASVPIAGALVRRGVTPAAAIAFLLASPAVNPVVLAATAVAFAGNPRMVAARAVASLVTACVMGWLWLRIGRPEWIKLPPRPELAGTSRSVAFWAACRHDLTQSGGFLVVGAAAAATLNVAVPKHWLQALGHNPVLGVLTLAVLAVVLSICSEADAFVAASLREFSLTARLAFLVVGPMVDLKLFAMQAGTFGRGFANRFAPATFLLAIIVSAAVGLALL